MYYLYYDNGTGWFDCASAHRTLESAIAAAETGWQPRQHILDENENVVWKNYTGDTDE